MRRVQVYSSIRPGTDTVARVRAACWSFVVLALSGTSPTATSQPSTSTVTSSGATTATRAVASTVQDSATLADAATFRFAEIPEIVFVRGFADREQLGI